MYALIAIVALTFLTPAALIGALILTDGGQASE